MATPPLLDFEACVAPIPGDNPAGESLPFDVKERLEEARKEDNPDDYPPEERPSDLKKADWPGIVALAQQTLCHTSKDLLVAARLTEALTRVSGFAGLRDGLHLMRLLVEEAWDRLRPAIEEPDDIERRAGPFHWLDDADKGARFPNTLFTVPVVTGKGASYSFMDWKRAQEGKGAVTSEDFQQAMMATPLEQLQTALEDLEESAREIMAAIEVLNSRMGSAAPAFTGIRGAVEQCRQLLQGMLRQRPSSLVPASDESATGNGVVPADGASGIAGTIASRGEAYQQLARAAAVLKQLEPHSPIPYLVERAVELGQLSFPQLIRELVRDANVLMALNRELGIKDPTENVSS